MTRRQWALWTLRVIVGAVVMLAILAALDLAARG